MNQQKKPVGRPKQNNVQYKRNIKPEFVKIMDEYLQELKSKEIAIYINSIP